MRICYLQALYACGLITFFNYIYTLGSREIPFGEEEAWFSNTKEGEDDCETE
jgi:hypothetical protein